jgi:hypothetical protein
MKMNDAVLMMPCASSGCVPAFASAAPIMPPMSAWKSSTGCRNTGDEIPGDGADQRAEDQPVVDKGRIDDPLPTVAATPETG